MPDPRTPPSSIEAEACVLGSCLLSAEALTDAVAEVNAAWFYRPAHQVIFAKLKEMASEGSPVDLVLLRDGLGDSLASIGGVEYLADLVRGVPNADSISHYADIIKDKYTKRQLIINGTAIVDAAYDDAVSATEAVGKAYELVQRAGEEQRTRRQVSAGEAMASMIKHAEAVRDGHITPSLPSGMPHLDAMLTGGGFRPGNLILLAGRPSKGKSMVATDWARYMAQHNAGVLFVSGEMIANEIMERHASAMTDIYAAKIAQGKITKEDIASIGFYEAHKWNMEIMDTSAAISEIASEAKRLSSKWNGGLSCVIIDYLGLMRPSGKVQNREQAVGEMARECKMYAQSMNIPWIALHQLNRDGASGRPEMHQLRDSGQLEEHANTVLLLDWDTEQEHYDAPENGGPWRHLMIRVAKQRAGLTSSWGGAIHRKLRGCLTRTELLHGLDIPE